MSAGDLRETGKALAKAVLALDADHAWWVTEDTHRCEDCGAQAKAPSFPCEHAPECRVAPVLAAIDAHRAAMRAAVAWAMPRPQQSPAAPAAATHTNQGEGASGSGPGTSVNSGGTR